MKRAWWVALSVLVLAAIVARLVLRDKPETLVLDLAKELPNTVRNLPSLDAFKVQDTTIAGVTKRAITFHGSSRLAWHVTVPDRAWLSFSLGVREEAWKTEGDGVVFRVTVYDEPLLSLTVNPFKESSDRRWQDFMLDLSEYAGETIDIYLKTDLGPLGTQDDRGDDAAWGDAKIVIR